MNNIIRTSISVLAAAVSLACGNAVAQDNPVSRPEVTQSPEGLRLSEPEKPWQPDAERVPARPEQVEEAIDEVLDPEDDETDSLDTDRINSGPPTDDRIISERIDSTLQDESITDDDAALEPKEVLEDR